MKDLDIKSFYRHDIPINKKNHKKINKIEDTITKNPRDKNKKKISTIKRWWNKS